ALGRPPAARRTTRRLQKGANGRSRTLLIEDHASRITRCVSITICRPKDSRAHTAPGAPASGGSGVWTFWMTGSGAPRSGALKLAVDFQSTVLGVGIVVRRVATLDSLT